MFELVFSFKNNTLEYSEKLKSAFKNCRQSSFEEADGIIKIALDSSSDNWINIWSAVWELTEQEWFVSAASDWELVVSKQELVFKEDLLAYCRKNKKGLFRNNPE
ncbi:MAG: hypothetical protein IKK53_00935 [Ruminiclostridium sp.]|nr:hypothetical protein [Ruminiclostridium sp.]